MSVAVVDDLPDQGFDPLPLSGPLPPYGQAGQGASVALVGDQLG
ncbi:hypothetical protein AB0G67_43970 [Streptomyces sp. NPDC021056]